MAATIRTPIAARDQHLVVVVAHPDDESFGCGSLIAQASRAGARVTVICATRGEAGERRPDPTTDAWPIGLLREAELCQAAIVLGVDEVVLLDLVDSGFSGEAPGDALISRPVDEVADDLVDRLADLRPDVVLTLDGSDGHRDHIHLRDALGLAVARLHRPPRLVHSCLARSLMTAWASEMRLHEPHREHLSIGDEQLGRPDDELAVIDTGDVLAVRERAIACHLSQTSPFDNLPPTLRHRFLTIDHVIEVVPGELVEHAVPTPVHNENHHAFNGVLTSVPAGTTLAFRNSASAELHELVAFRLSEGDDIALADLAKLPGDELGPRLGAPVTVLLQLPGSDEQITAVGDGMLEQPGRYVLMCFIPTGADPQEYLAAAAASEGEAPTGVAGGPPHFVNGMYAELQVDA